MKNILNNIQSEVLNYYNENNINKQRELGNKIINYFNVLQDCKNSLILINTKSDKIFNDIKNDIKNKYIDNTSLKSKFIKRKNISGKINYQNILEMDLKTFLKNYSFVISFEKEYFKTNYILDINKVQKKIIAVMIDLILFMIKSVARGKEENFSIITTKSIEYLYQYEKDIDCKYTTWIWKRLNNTNIDFIKKINKKNDLYYNYMIKSGISEKNELTEKTEFKSYIDLEDGYYQEDNQENLASFNEIVRKVLESNKLTMKEQAQFMKVVKGDSIHLQQEARVKIQSILNIDSFKDIFSSKKYY